MHADFSIEMGRDDPVLEVPWSSPDANICYYDLKHHPDLLSQIPEALAYSDLGEFLARINAPEFPLETAKCDAWFSQEVAPEEEVYGGTVKLVSYTDLVFTGIEQRSSFAAHEALAQDLCTLLHRAPEISATVEMVLRRCYSRFSGSLDELHNGFSMTTYVSGFGGDREHSRKNWGIALKLLQNALVQVATRRSSSFSK